MEHVAERIRTLAGWPRAAFAVGAGAAMALGQAPVSWPVMLFLALPVVLRLMDGTAGPRAAFRLGWLVGVGYFATALFWIVDPFLVDPVRHGWMAPFALLGMAGGGGLFWAVPFAAARAVWPTGARRVLVLASLWSLAELARAYLFGGFPWALLAYAWVETPLIQLAAPFGPYLLGFLTLVAGLLPGLATWRAVGAAAAMVAAGLAFGALRLSEPVPARDPALVVRIVQPNAVQEAKWDPVEQQAIYARLLAETAAPGTPRPAVTVWPETAVPFLLGEAPAAQAEIAAAAGPAGRVILGIRRAEGAPGREDWFNTLAVLGPDGSAEAVYDKHRLVPFGEYIPLVRRLSALGFPGIATLTGTGFSPGPGPRLLSVPGLPPFLPLICYEAIFPHALRLEGPRPDWLVQVTNDAWFGELSGPYQHLAQARVRAIEQGLPLVRSANTGISAMIDPRGRVIDSLPLGVAGHLDVTLPGVVPPPIYARLGDVPGILGLLAVFGLTFVNFYDGVFRSRRR